MKLRDRIAELETELGMLRDTFEVALDERLDALLSNPLALRAAILERAQTANTSTELMSALRALETLDTL